MLLISVLSVFTIHAEIKHIKYHMMYNIESVTYIFEYTMHVLGYISVMIIGLYKSKVKIQWIFF